MIGFKKEPNRVVNAGTAGKQLHIILVELAIALVDTAIDCGCKHPKVVEVIAQDVVATVLIVPSLMMILYIKGAYSTPSKVYSLR